MKIWKRLLWRDPWFTLYWMLWKPYCLIFGHKWIVYETWTDFGREYDVDGCERCLSDYPYDA